MSYRRYNRVQKHIYKIVIASILTIIIAGIFTLICFLIKENQRSNPENVEVSEAEVFSVVEEFLTPNEYSRPQKKLKSVKGVVVHYTANPGTDAQANRNYFEGLAASGATYASSHFIIGLDGTIIQCVPITEVAYASNDRNDDTISIECCHKKKNGRFTKETYDSLVKLVAWLCNEFGLEEEDIIRHYDVTGKMCPLYFVKHEDKWTQFKNDVMNFRKEL